MGHYFIIGLDRDSVSNFLSNPSGFETETTGYHRMEMLALGSISAKWMEAEGQKEQKYNVEGTYEENESLTKPIEAGEVIVNGFIRKYILS